MFYKVFIIIFSSILLVPNFMQKERRRFEERAEEKFVILRFPNTPHQIFTKQNTIVGLFAWISFPSSTSDNNIFIWNFYSKRTDRKLEWILIFFKKKKTKIDITIEQFKRRGNVNFKVIPCNCSNVIIFFLRFP